MNTWPKEDDLEWISEPLWELSEKRHSHSLVTWAWMCVMWSCRSPSHHLEGNTYLRMKPPGEGISERWTETGPWQYFWNMDPVILEARPMLVHISHRNQAISSPPPLPLPPSHLPLLPPPSPFFGLSQLPFHCLLTVTLLNWKSPIWYWYKGKCTYNG